MAEMMDALVRAIGSVSLLLLLGLTMADYQSIPQTRRRPRRWYEHLMAAVALFGFGIYLGVIWLVRP